MGSSGIVPGFGGTASGSVRGSGLAGGVFGIGGLSGAGMLVTSALGTPSRQAHGPLSYRHVQSLC
jgi:hypothetical protein